MGIPANDLTGRDGVVLSQSDPAYKTKLYQRFGNSWRISQAESLFDYQPGESTATFTHLDFPSSTATLASARSRGAGERRSRSAAPSASMRSPGWMTASSMSAPPGMPPLPSRRRTSSSAGAPTTIPGSSARPGDADHDWPGGDRCDQRRRSQHADYTFTATGRRGRLPRGPGGVRAPTRLNGGCCGPTARPSTSRRSCNDLGREVLPTAGIYTVRENSSGTARPGPTRSPCSRAGPTGHPDHHRPAGQRQHRRHRRDPRLPFSATAGQVVYSGPGAVRRQPADRGSCSGPTARS